MDGWVKKKRAQSPPSSPVRAVRHVKPRKPRKVTISDTDAEWVVREHATSSKLTCSPPSPTDVEVAAITPRFKPIAGPVAPTRTLSELTKDYQPLKTRAMSPGEDDEWLTVADGGEADGWRDGRMK